MAETEQWGFLTDEECDPEGFEACVRAAQEFGAVSLDGWNLDDDDVLHGVTSVCRVADGVWVAVRAEPIEGREGWRMVWATSVREDGDG